MARRGRAIVGDLAGAALETLPSSTMPWGQWRELHPGGVVLSRDTGFDRPYERDPFLGFEERVSAGQLPFPSAQDPTADTRLDPGAEVLWVAVDGQHVAYPIAALGDRAVNDTIAGQPIVVLAAGGESAIAYDPRVDGRTLTFVADNERFVDEETGTRWDQAGRALDGPLEGAQLEPLPSRVTFWFAYVAAFPDVEPRDLTPHG